MSKIGNADLSKVYIGNTEVANIYIGNTMVYQNLVAIPYPVLSGSYTFNNSAQTPTFTNYDATTSDIGGTYSAMNAGSYTATFTPKRGYCWADKSVGAYSVSWNISPKDITGATITLNGSLTYNGGAQTQNISSVVIDGLTATYSVSGNTGTNAGNYTLTCSGNGNFTGSQTKAWSIAKAAGSLSLSSSSGKVGPIGGTTSFTITRAGDGAISVSSSNTGIATVTLSGTTATVKCIAKGSATITVSVAAGTNYTAPANKTWAATCQRLPSSFQEVEYIQSSGTQKIDTAVASAQNIGAILDFQYTVTTSSGFRDICGSYKPYATSGTFHLLINHGGYIKSCLGTSEITLQSQDTNRHIAIINNASHEVYFDGVYKGTHNVTTYTSGFYNLGLFAPFSSETPASDFYASAKIYSAQITDGSTIKRNYITCYCTTTVTGYKGSTAVSCESGTIGLYDLANNRFYVNSGSGTFTKGGNV